MIWIDDKILSLDILEKYFCCDLPQCQGQCCVVGQSGAPLEPQEAELLGEHLRAIEPYLKPEGLEAVRRQGVAVIDADADLVTPLVSAQGECAYAVLEDGITGCAIERAWAQGAIPFRKPISCHLYPIRVRRFPDFQALNYDQWEVCAPARAQGQRLGLPAYQFLRDALTRAYGQAFYLELEAAAGLLRYGGAPASLRE